MAIAATGTLLPQVSIPAQSLIILVVVFAVNMPCIGIWTFFGRAMADIFKTDRTRRIVNIVLGVALVATIPMMLL
jgi:threonine/homoserine/homoserine lactone efflux protein